MGVRNEEVKEHKAQKQLLADRNNSVVYESEFLSNDAAQTWIIGKVDKDGYFTLTNSCSQKYLTAISGVGLKTQGLKQTKKRYETQFEKICKNLVKHLPSQENEINQEPKIFERMKEILENEFELDLKVTTPKIYVPKK